MSKSKFNNVKITGIKTVIPAHFIDIDDELQYFDNNQKKMTRAKKITGYGRRYVVDPGTTVVDMCVDAAEKLFLEMDFDRNKIDALIFVNQKPDYREPADTCIAHGKLNLGENCMATGIPLGCSGYAYALFTAHAMIACKAVKCCLVLAGDIATHNVPQNNRKIAQLFGDACSATIVEYSDEPIESAFVLGTRGADWDKIVTPMGGTKLPVDKQAFDILYEDTSGNIWNPIQPVMQGESVFNFTKEIAPKIIHDTMNLADKTLEDIDMFVVHQANKQIVETIASIADLPLEKVPTETFTKYANNSTNSVVTVICDTLLGVDKPKIILCSFGIGLSWGAAYLDLSYMYNAGISTYFSDKNKETREEQIEKWAKLFQGEI